MADPSSTPDPAGVHDYVARHEPQSRTCHYCGPTDRELRPYGPGGATVCFPCVKATPEREQAAAGVFGALLDMTSSVGLTAIGTESGPINVDPADIAGTAGHA